MARSLKTRSASAIARSLKKGRSHQKDDVTYSRRRFEIL